METIGRAKRVVIYIGESDKWGEKPLYMAILELLKKEDCAGATVTRALAGFGAHSRIRTASIVALSADLPLIIEWVDNLAKVERIMPRLHEMIREGLITSEDVDVVFYSHRELRHLSAFVPVQDIMSRQLHTVRPDTPLVEVVEQLIDRDGQTLPVIDDSGRLTGIITSGDLLREVDLLHPNIYRHLSEAEWEVELQRLRKLTLIARDVMTSDPVSVTVDTTIPRVVELMLDRDIKRLPIIDGDSKLIGLVTRVDVLRAFARPLTTKMYQPLRSLDPHARIEDIMITDVPTVTRNASLSAILALLVGSQQRRVVVVDNEQRVIGIITDGDLLKRAAPTERAGILRSLAQWLPLGQGNEYHLDRRAASEVMTSPVVTIPIGTSPVSALQLLLQHRIKRLPVVDDQGRLVGLIGRWGILRAMAHNSDTRTEPPSANTH